MDIILELISALVKKVRVFEMECLAEDRRVKMVPVYWYDKLIDQLVDFM